jgi:predicted nucleic acid-binding protein
MSGRTFVDTNVLIYAHDVDAGQKHEIARNVLRELWSEREGVLSMQVLQEFYVNVTRKIATPLPRVTGVGACKRQQKRSQQLFALKTRRIWDFGTRWWWQRRARVEQSG